MEYKLKKTVNLRPQNTVWQMAIKKLMDLLLVDICYINAVGFYWNLVQLDTIAFTTSLYKINQMIKEKKIWLRRKTNL